MAPPLHVLTLDPERRLGIGGGDQVKLLNLKTREGLPLDLPPPAINWLRQAAEGALEQKIIKNAREAVEQVMGPVSPPLSGPSPESPPAGNLSPITALDKAELIPSRVHKKTPVIPWSR